jgi:hypothetical protein
MKYAYSKNHDINYGINSKLYSVSPGDIDPKGDNSIISSNSIENEKALETSLFLSDEITVNKKLSFNVGASY